MLGKELRWHAMAAGLKGPSAMEVSPNAVLAIIVNRSASIHKLRVRENVIAMRTSWL